MAAKVAMVEIKLSHKSGLFNTATWFFVEMDGSAGREGIKSKRPIKAIKLMALLRKKEACQLSNRSTA
ncbi:hypothetical protein D3C87_1503620 [compost metagenome]